jgi:hypothetical protein
MTGSNRRAHASPAAGGAWEQQSAGRYAAPSRSRKQASAGPTRDAWFATVAMAGSDRPAATGWRGAALGSVDSPGMAAFPDDVVKGLVRLVCRPFGPDADAAVATGDRRCLPWRVPVIAPASAPGTKSRVYDRQAGGDRSIKTDP